MLAFEANTRTAFLQTASPRPPMEGVFWGSTGRPHVDQYPLGVCEQVRERSAERKEEQGKDIGRGSGHVT